MILGEMFSPNNKLIEQANQLDLMIKLTKALKVIQSWKRCNNAQ